MLNDQSLKDLMDGKMVTVSPSRRGAKDGELVQFVPIRSPKTGRVIRINVYSVNPKEKGKERK